MARAAVPPAPAKGSGARAVGRRPLSEKGKRAIAILVERSAAGVPVSVGAAMREAGFSPKTANTPKLLTERAGYKEAVEPFVTDLIAHRDAILARLKDRLPNADYGTLVYALDTVTRNVQLLTGRATGRLGFTLPEDERRLIEGIVAQNS